MLNIDNSDKRILSSLHRNSRSSISRISKETGLTREIVNYRIKKLEEEGVIKGYIAKINQSLFCEGVANLSLKLVKSEENRFKEIINFLVLHHSINWVAEISGNADLIATILYKNLEDLANIISDITQFIGNNLREHQLSLYITEYKFDREGIISNKPPKQLPEPIISFGKNSIIELDKKDFIIISELAQNCRIRNIELAKKSKIGEDMVRLRIKKMEKNNVIFGYGLVMDVTEYGLESYYLSLHIEQMTKEKISKLRYYVWNNPYIGYCARTAGRYNVVISLYAKNRKHFNDLLSDIRKYFALDLVDYEFNLNIKEHKEIFLPQNFLNTKT